MPREKKRQEEGRSVPAWVVSFSDMVTLLLAFFVLLQSFARVQDPEMFFVGQGSFKSAIAGMGLPSWLLGRQDKPQREHPKVEHPMDQVGPAVPAPRNIDAEGENSLISPAACLEYVYHTDDSPIRLLPSAPAKQERYRSRVGR